MKKIFTLIACAVMACSAMAAESVDLTKDVFFQYNSNTDGSKLDEPKTIGCDYNVGISNGMVYGLSTVKWYAYADITSYKLLVLNVTEGTPRVMYNREIDPAKTPEADGVNHVEITTDSPYLTIGAFDNNSKDYVYDLKAMAAANPAKPYVHINAIKGANWANTTVTSMKLYMTTKDYLEEAIANANEALSKMTVESVKAQLKEDIDVANGVYNDANASDSEIISNAQSLKNATEVAVTTGINTVSVAPVKVAKAMENGKVVIVKNGKKFNVAGQAM